jgi:hypothetical protein
MIAALKRWLGLTPPPALVERSQKARADLEAFMREREAVDRGISEIRGRIQQMDMHVLELKLWASKLPKNKS